MSLGNGSFPALRCLHVISMSALMLFAATSLPAQVQVESFSKINYSHISDTDTLFDFGTSICVIGDLDLDGVEDMAVGEPRRDNGRGAVRILFMKSNGTVKSDTIISSTMGGFTGILDDDDRFGQSIGWVGDLDGDGYEDIAVGAHLDDDGGDHRGAVWILFMNPDGSVKSHQKISDTEGGFTGTLDNSDYFGSSVGQIGDFDGDSVTDIAIGAMRDDDGGSDRGAVWLLFLNSNGTVKSHQKISDTDGGFTGTLYNSDYFGYSVSHIGDLDNDGYEDIVVGAPYTWDEVGSVWILFLNSDGTVKSHTLIDYSSVLPISNYDYFGTSVLGIGDHNGDGVEDIAVGAPDHYFRYMYNYGEGRVFIVFLNTDGTIDSYFQHQWGWDIEGFGAALGRLGDASGDGNQEIAAGAPGDDSGGEDYGAVYVMNLNTSGIEVSRTKISARSGNFREGLDGNDMFGESAAAIGDLNNDGYEDIAVGSPGDLDRSERNEGSIRILLLDDQAEVISRVKLGAADDSLSGYIDDADKFGHCVAALGDLDGDGAEDIAVGAPQDGDGGMSRGAVYIIFLNSDGTMKELQKISDIEGSFSGILEDGDQFGSSIGTIGDLDGDTVVDLVIGAPGDSDGGFDPGAAWILFLNTDGTVKSHQKISMTSGGFTGEITWSSYFGNAAAGIGDIDGDGIEDIAIGNYQDDDNGNASGAVWVIFLNTDGTVKGHHKISGLTGNFIGQISQFDLFGYSVDRVGDIDGDGRDEIAVGTPGISSPIPGPFWVLYLNTDGSVRSFTQLGLTEGSYAGAYSVAPLGDLDSNGFIDLAVGSSPDDDGGFTHSSGYTRHLGAAWIIYLEEQPPVTGVSDAIVDIGPIEFGTFADTTVTLTNAGGGTITGTIGASCGDFSILSGEGFFSLLPDEIHDIEIRYEPATRGRHSCTIDINDDSTGYHSVQCYGRTIVNVTVATDPDSFEVSAEGGTYTAPYQFTAGAGDTLDIGTFSPIDSETGSNDEYIFHTWSDGGDINHQVIMGTEDTTITATFKLHFLYAAIDTILDVPGDQGGWVRVNILRSTADSHFSQYSADIVGYNVFRRVENPYLIQMIKTEGEKISHVPYSLADFMTDRQEFSGMNEESSIEWLVPFSYGPEISFTRFEDRWYLVQETNSDTYIAAAPPGTWEVISAIFPREDNLYIQLASTRQDSSLTIPWEAFFVSTHFEGGPQYHFDSPPDSGYSVDNIAPGVPLGLAVEYNTGTGNQLTWDECPDEDFQFFRVYRGESEDFIPGPGSLAHSTSETSWTDGIAEGWRYTYKITALDDAGNESDAGVVMISTDSRDSGVPQAFALYQNVPNPFNPATTILFDLPRPAHVTLDIYNVKGQKIIRLVDRRMTPGRKEVVWNARSRTGAPVASGIYFYRLIVDDFTETRKMVLLR